MLVLGDVFAVVAALAGIFLTAYAVIVASGLLIGDVLDRSATITQESLGKSLVTGILVGLPALTITLVLSNLPAPLLKVIGLVSLFAVFGISLIGAAGIAHMAGRRIQTMDPSMSQFGAFSRATAVLVGATLFPFVGWMLIAPMVLLVGFGSASRAIFGRTRSLPEAV